MKLCGVINRECYLIKKNLANEEYISMAKIESLYFQNKGAEYSTSQTEDKWDEIHEEIVHTNIIRMKMELWGQLWLYWENKLILVAYIAVIHHTKIYYTTL